MSRIVTSQDATCIDREELAALIPNINLQSELNQYERENIRDAIRWAAKSKTIRKDLLTVHGLKKLHKKMFGEVWQWAGTFRTTEKNIGCVLAYQVPEEVLKLCDDSQFQIKKGIENWELFAVQFYHRLVSIHPFPNGNGRCARLAADLLLQFNGRSPLSWGASEVSTEEDLRRSHIDSLKAADKGNIHLLFEFATSTRKISAKDR